MPDWHVADLQTGPKMPFFGLTSSRLEGRMPTCVALAPYLLRLIWDCGSHKS